MIRRTRGNGIGVAGLAGVVLCALLVIPAAEAEQPIPPPRPARNLYGMTGLIDMPSAGMQPDAELGFTSSYFGGYLRNTITVQALPWLEASFRYSVLDNMLPGPAETTLYDRSFDVKLRLIEEGPGWPALAVGLQDFLGTGVYSGEYIVGTKSFLDGDLKLTAGIGWGRFAGNAGIGNPLCRSGNRFCNRPGSDGTGGSVDIGNFFSGKKMGVFGGAEWQTPIDGLTLKAEYSDDDYDRERELGDFKHKLPLNFGVEYRPMEGIELGAYYMYGSEVGVRLSLSANPFRPAARVDGEPAPLALAARPQPDPKSGRGLFGKIKALLGAKRVTTRFEESGIAQVEFPPRQDGLRWAEATLPASADDTCPDAAALAIDAEFGVVDAVTFRHADGRLVCTVALRPAGEAAIRQAVRGAAKYPTDWYQDEAQRRAAVEKLIAGLEPDRIGLFGIELEPDRVTVYIENAKFRAMPRAIGRTARALSAAMPASVELFEIVPIEHGLPVVSVVLRRSALEDQTERPDAARAAWLTAELHDAAPIGWGDVDGTMRHFPRFSWSINPSVPVNWFDPDQPLRFDLAVSAAAAVELMPGLSLNAAVLKPLAGNLGDIDPYNDSELPHVRSDVSRYLAEGDPAISRLSADYVTKLTPELYGRLSAGYLERMFGGVSAELLWKPADQDWGLGAEINWVKQRDFDQRFGFRGYDVVTGHASVYWDTNWYGLSAQVDAGRYLAGDWGGTLTVKRRFANGWEFGGFFTLTDVPFSKFGEGSFDKGLFLTIPFNWFLPYESRSKFSTSIRPLSRDGGQRLVIENRLYPMVEDADRSALRSSWGDFWE